MGTKNATTKPTAKVKDLPAKNGKDVKGVRDLAPRTAQDVVGGAKRRVYEYDHHY